MHTGWDNELLMFRILTPSEDKLERWWWIATRRSISSSGEVGHSPELTLLGPFRLPAPTIGDGVALLLWGGSTTDGMSSEMLASSATWSIHLQLHNWSLSIQALAHNNNTMHFNIIFITCQGTKSTDTGDGAFHTHGTKRCIPGSDQKAKGLYRGLIFK
jgi:hypothetical protein